MILCAISKKFFFNLLIGTKLRFSLHEHLDVIISQIHWVLFLFLVDMKDLLCFEPRKPAGSVIHRKMEWNMILSPICDHSHHFEFSIIRLSIDLVLLISVWNKEESKYSYKGLVYNKFNSLRHKTCPLFVNIINLKRISSFNILIGTKVCFFVVHNSKCPNSTLSSRVKEFSWGYEGFMRFSTIKPLDSVNT